MDYAVKVTVRNGRILRLMREAGIETQAELARRAGISMTCVNAIVCLRNAPEKTNGEWRYGVEEIAAVLHCDPEELFSDVQRTLALPSNSHEVYLDEPQMAQLASGDMEREQWAKLEVQRLLEGVTPRERAVIEAISEGCTFEEAGQVAATDGFGPVSRARAREIYEKGLRRMKRRAIAFRD